jgi:hypothetical protein
MHLISFDASPKQLSRLRNGHNVRIKKGAGFNLVVNPSNYHLVSRAFGRNKGVEIKLSPEELSHNQDMSPEQHESMADSIDNNLFEHLPFAEGGSIFKKAKRVLNSKAGKSTRRALKPAGRAFLEAGKDMGHQQLAEAHMGLAEHAGSNPNLQAGLNLLAQAGHEGIHNTGRKGGALFKFLGNKKVKGVRRALKPAGRAFYNAGQDMLHDQLAQMQMAGSQYVPQNPNAQMGYQLLGQAGHDAIGYNRNPYYGMNGYGLGAGANAHTALKMANLATANANHQLAKMHNATIHGQQSQPPIKRYYNDDMAPPSRGTGLHNHMNMIRGRGSMLRADDILPPALQSQPYGANWHMQFFLPPQYHKYNDGTDMVGNGLYI